MRRAAKERDSYDADQAALFAQLGGRPAGEVGSTAGTVNEVLIHYFSAAQVAIDQADAVAVYADDSWTAEVDTFAWRAPLLDDGSLGHGGTTDLDIYLSNVGGGGAYTAPETSGGSNTWTTFIVIDPSVPNIETYVAHEFNHSIQFAYDDTEADWLFEATATWMEDKVYDAVDDYLFFTGDFQTLPTRTLSYATYNDTYMYGGTVFLHYLSERFDNDGTTLVRGLWTDSTSVDFYDALEDTILPALGAGAPDDLMGLYADFAGYRWLTGSNSDGWSDEAASWTRASYGKTYADLASATGNGNTVTANPMKLGTSYIEVRTPDGVNGDRLTFTMNGAAGTSWAVTVVGQPAAGSATVTVVRDDDGDGTIVATSDSNNQFERVAFAVVNLGVAGQNPDRDTGGGHSADVTTSSYSYDLFYSATGGDPVPEEPVACECNATRAEPGSGFLLLGLLGFAAVLAVRARG